MDLELPNMDETMGAAFDKASTDVTNELPPVTEEKPSEDETAAPEGDESTTEVEVAPTDEDVTKAAEPTPDGDAGDTTPAPRDEALDAVLESHRGALTTDGMSLAQGVEQLLTISEFANRDPEGFIQWFSQQRGLSASPTKEPTPEPEVIDDDDEFLDPAFKSLRDKVRSLEAEQTAQQEQQRQARNQEVQAQVTAFAQAKDESGELKHPHFEKLRPTIGALMNAGQMTLDAAYEQACWADSGVRKQMQEKAEAVRLEQAKAAALKAQKAATQVRTPGGQFAPTKTRTMDETMSETYDRAAGA